MTRNNQETLVIVKPRKILQIISVFIEIFWIVTILRSLQGILFKNYLYLSPVFFLFIVLFILSLFWIVLNTINTQIVVTTDGIMMLGVLWKTHISWKNVKKIDLIYYQKNSTRAVEIYANPKQIPFNNKISFDSNVHRDIRRGVYYILELAGQHNISVKTAGWLSPTTDEWKEWAKN